MGLPRAALLSLLLGVLCPGCGSPTEDSGAEAAGPEEPAADDSPAPDPEGAAQPAAVEAAPEPSPAAPGLIPGLDFPAVATTVGAEQAVFVPTAQALQDLAGNTDASVSFGWVAATMITPGDVESQVRRGLGTPYTCPNSLIVAVEPDPAPAPASLVVSAAPSGFRVERVQSVADTGVASVVAIWAGSPRESTRNAGTWWVPSAAGAAGTYLHCLEAADPHFPGAERESDRFIMLKSQGEQNLVMAASAGSAVSVVPAASCAALPLDATARVGATILATDRGHVRTMTVRSVDRATGVITASYDFLGTDTEATVLPGAFALP